MRAFKPHSAHLFSSLTEESLVEVRPTLWQQRHRLVCCESWILQVLNLKFVLNSNVYSWIQIFQFALCEGKWSSGDFGVSLLGNLSTFAARSTRTSSPSVQLRKICSNSLGAQHQLRRAATLHCYARPCPQVANKAPLHCRPRLKIFLWHVPQAERWSSAGFHMRTVWRAVTSEWYSTSFVTFFFDMKLSVWGMLGVVHSWMSVWSCSV